MKGTFQRIEILCILWLQCYCFLEKWLQTVKYMKLRKPFWSFLVLKTVQVADISETCLSSLAMCAFCYGNMRCSFNEKIVDNEDKLFRNEPTRRAYCTLCTLNVQEETESFILSIALLDAVIEVVVDFLTLEQSMEVGVNIVNTVHLDHISGKMISAEKTIIQ